MSTKIKSLLRVQQIEQELRREAQTSHLELIQELANTRMGIPAELIRAYDRAKRRYPDAITRLENGICQGCHMAAPTGVAIVAKSGKSIHVCEYCSRLIYSEIPAAASEPPTNTPKKKKTRKNQRQLV